MINVYFGTNRNPRPADKPRNFGKHFSSVGLSDLRFGKATVTGNKVEVTTHKEKLVQLGDAKRTDIAKSTFGSQKLFDDMHNAMHASHRDTVLFIHGYNVSFKEAMKSAAKLAQNFSGVNGGKGVNVACFSWPSDGSMRPWVAYSSDRRDAAASGPAFARGLLKVSDFLRKLTSEQACDQKIHLVAHSMGNYVLRHAVQEIRRQSPGGMPRIFDQIFLMAADEDDDTFEHDHKLKLLPRLGKQVHVYFNRNDHAMAISDTTKGNPDRLGDDGPRAPFQVPGKVTQIDCTPAVTGLIEHSYFLDEPKVIADMAQVLEGVDPASVVGRNFLDDRNRFVITH
jgi:esterase/lipase superfamily enzyme